MILPDNLVAVPSLVECVKVRACPPIAKLGDLTLTFLSTYRMPPSSSSAFPISSSLRFVTALLPPFPRATSSRTQASPDLGID